MLTFDHVSFGYDEKQLTIPDLSFSIDKGEIVALIGSNGAGKSTISRLANGLLKPVKGTVTVDQADTKHTKTSEIAKKIGFLFQNPDRQICENTVFDEIAFNLKLRGLSKTEIQKKVEDMLNTFHLNPDWFPFSRSRGERQRIALASVLVGDPDLIILDEPTTGLDYKECIEIMDYIKKLNTEKQLTVLMVSHDMELVQEYAKRVLVLNQGLLLGDGPVREIMKNEELLHNAKVLPAQIPALALRFGERFRQVYTVGEMEEAIEKEVKK